MSNDVLATLQGLKSHFLLQLSEMPEYRAMKALEKTIAEVTEILSPANLSAAEAKRAAAPNEADSADLRAAEAAIAGVIPARTASPTALRIPTMPMTRRF
jgi:hypothetical protein